MELIEKPWFSFLVIMLFIFFIKSCSEETEHYNTGAIGPYSYSSGNYAYGTGDRYDKQLNKAYLHEIGW